MKHILTISMLLAILFPLQAQNKSAVFQLNGQIVNKSTGEGIPYATIILKNDSLKVKKMLACNLTGQFAVNIEKSGTYNLIATAIGYTELNMPVRINNSKTDLGKLQMEESTMMKEVVVTAQKPLVKVDIDKIVYSIESDPEAQTNTAFDMLRKLPLVTVDAEDNVTVNGQSNFKVLVNGKSSPMMTSNFKDALKSMPASSVKNIEVITNPSTKYDAEGVGGILNIITNKKTLGGYNGSLNGGVNTRGGFNAGLYLAAKVSDFSFSMRGFGSQYYQPDITSTNVSEYYNNNDFHFLHSSEKSSYNGMGRGISCEASYDIDSLDLISLSLWGYNGSYTQSAFTETQYLDVNNGLTRMYSSTMNSKDTYGSLSGNIDYQKSFKKPDESLTLSYKLDSDPDKTRYNSIIDGTLNYPSYNQRSKNDAVGREHTFQADYFNPVSKIHQIEGGGKFILRQNKSNSETYRNDTLNARYGNDLNYDQYIMGLYAGYGLKLDKIAAKAGLRLERTWNDGKSTVESSITNFTNKFINLIPYINFSYMPTKTQTIKASYTKRLSRPGIWYLNPYVNNADSMNISYGNPSLVAEISHSIEVGYSLFTKKLNLSVTSNNSFVNNSIESIVKVQSNGATLTTYENIGKNRRYALDFYVSYRPNDKLTINLNGTGDYSKIESNNGINLSNKGFSSNAFLSARMTLWKDGSLNIYSGYSASRIELQGKSPSYFYSSFGASQYLLKRKLMLSCSLSDPFWRTRKYKSESSDMTFYSHHTFQYLSRMARFNLTFNFGKTELQVKKANRGINNDDLKQGGGQKSGE